jgi:hypothetical protein
MPHEKVEPFVMSLAPLPKAKPTKAPPQSASATPKSSPVTRESPFKSTPIALPPESPGTRESPSIHDSPKPIYRKGDSRIVNDFFDERLCGLDVTAQLLYFHLNRYRDAGGDVTIPLSWRRLTERIPVSESTLRRAYAVLNNARLVSIERAVYGKGSAQGNIFRVVRGESPSVRESPSTDDTHKSKEVKAKVKGVSLCDLCRHMSGHVYVDRDNPQLGVKRCDHRHP